MDDNFTYMGADRQGRGGGGFADFNPIQAGWAFSGLLTNGGDLES